MITGSSPLLAGYPQTETQPTLIAARFKCESGTLAAARNNKGRDMPDRIALKRLTASDLTLFETLFRKLNVGNQKSINLNADVFIEVLYPSLPDLVSTLGDRIAVSLTIIGPNGAPPYVLTRAITKREAYKNWRLNGEFILDPDAEPGRFDMLSAGDLAVFDFAGEPGPQRVSLLLVSAQAPSDANIFASLNPLVPGGRKTMIQVSRAQLAGATAGVPVTHPIWTLTSDPDYDAALEDAALGGIEGIKRLATKAAKPVSASALAAAKASAEKNGRDGEALAWIHLQRLAADGMATSIQWTSNTNAVAPFDFSFVMEGKPVRADAKSTTGEFERAIHMSSAELTIAAEGDRYDLWRIYGITADGARLRISENIAPVAKAIMGGIGLPKGVTLDSVSINPGIFTWGAEVTIERPDESDFTPPQSS
jgi:hypothetical protein